jgi:hypothetical protein
MKSPLFHLLLWLLVFAGVLAGYGYWHSVLTGKSGEVANLENQITTKTQNSARAAAARNALADIKGEEDLVRGYFVPEADIVPFIDNLQTRAHAQTAEMKVLSVSTSGTDKPDNVSLRLVVTIDGTFDAVMRTVGSVEFAPYDISISKFAIHKTAKSAWHADLELVVGSVAADTVTGKPSAP